MKLTSYGSSCQKLSEVMVMVFSPKILRKQIFFTTHNLHCNSQIKDKVMKGEMHCGVISWMKT